MNQPKKTYGLVTAVAMIIGIVVGSGIYFKVDDILLFTGGSVPLGLLVLAIGACNIIFGSLTLSEYAKLETSSGGLVAYIDRFIGPGIATGFAWFQIFILMPSVVAIVAWVSGLYTGVLFNWDLSFTQQVLIGAAYILFFSGLNILSRLLGGYFQTLTMIIKLIPLLLIALIGLFWTAPYPSIPAGFTPVTTSQVGWGWLSALVPLAFAYEGWNYVVTITPELKHPSRDLVRALIIGPVIILVTYLLFFYGMVRILGSEFILSTGDQAITYAITLLAGERAGNFVLVVVILSILGVLNGILLAGMRLPQAFAEKGKLPKEPLASLHPRFQLSIPSALLFTGISLFWLLLHYLSQVSGLFTHNDVSEIAIVFNYSFYIIIYAKVIDLYRQGLTKQAFTSVFSPLMGILGALMVVIGSLISSPITTVNFSLICASMVIAGVRYYQRHIQKK